MKKLTLSTLLILALITNFLSAQDDEDLLSLIEEDPITDYATATFKTNRVINMHSVENTAKGVFDFKISHRFDPVSRGFYDIFGLDGATVRFGGDYGVTNRFQIGLGRSTFEKTYDGYLKYKLLRQSSGAKKIPVTLSAVTSASINGLENIDAERRVPFVDRFTYVSQLIIGRKFNSDFSFQVSPTFIHRNLVLTPDDNNDIFAVAFGTRQKLNKRVAINLEYVFVPDGQLGDEIVDSFSIGFDIETGGHVFQLHFTNSKNLFEDAVITQPTNNLWSLDGLHFGFNVSRVFTVGKR